MYFKPHQELLLRNDVHLGSVAISLGTAIEVLTNVGRIVLHHEQRNRVNDRFDLDIVVVAPSSFGIISVVDVPKYDGAFSKPPYRLVHKKTL